MFSKMHEKRGFTLVELMIVVAIIGILAAVAVPYYQSYIQKSRLTSKVFPGVHSIENNLATYYAIQQTFPSGATFATLTTDANTTCFGTPGISGSTITFTIRGLPTTCKELSYLNSEQLTAHPSVTSGKITGWQLSGSLVAQLGLSGEE